MAPDCPEGTALKRRRRFGRCSAARSPGAARLQPGEAGRPEPAPPVEGEAAVRVVAAGLCRCGCARPLSRRGSARSRCAVRRAPRPVGGEPLAVLGRKPSLKAWLTTSSGHHPGMPRLGRQEQALVTASGVVHALHGRIITRLRATESERKELSCPSVTDTSPACHAGSTPRSPNQTRLRSSTGAYSDGSSTTRCRRGRRAGT